MRAGVYFCMGSLRAAWRFVKETTRFPRRAKEGKGGQRRAEEGKGGQRRAKVPKQRNSLQIDRALVFNKHR
jgi:hypothetical protein